MPAIGNAETPAIQGLLATGVYPGCGTGYAWVQNGKGPSPNVACMIGCHLCQRTNRTVAPTRLKICADGQRDRPGDVIPTR